MSFAACAILAGWNGSPDLVLSCQTPPTFFRKQYGSFSIDRTAVERRQSLALPLPLPKQPP
jgi:hypothetical protein